MHRKTSTFYQQYLSICFGSADQSPDNNQPSDFWFGEYVLGMGKWNRNQHIIEDILLLSFSFLAQ